MNVREPEPVNLRVPERSSPAAPGTGVFCVLGVHRSGTSLMASLLAQAGVHMGSRLLPPSDDNPRGFYEDLDFFTFHEQCLAARRRHYADPGASRLEFSAAERGEARKLITARADLSRWGWKDPRTCLFVHDWHELLPNAHYVVVYRHPLGVLNSLLRRGERLAVADPSAGLRMWKVYSRAVLDFVNAHREQSLVFDTGVVFENPAKLCALLEGWGITLEPERVRSIARPGEFSRPAGLELVEPLIEAIDPEVLSIYRGFEAMADARSSAAPADARLASSLSPLVEVGANGLPDPAKLIRGELLTAALCMVDPALGARLEKHREGILDANDRLHGLEMERFLRGVTDENYRRWMDAEASARKNHEAAALSERTAQELYGQLCRERESAHQNYERALSAENASAANYERALTAEKNAKEHYEHLLAVHAEVEAQRGRLSSLEIVCESLTAELRQARTQILEETAVGQAVRRELESAKAGASYLEQRLQLMETERNYYRRRWPLYLARRIAEKVGERCLLHWHSLKRGPATDRFGAGARVGVMCTGLPESEHAPSLARALLAASRLVHSLTLPGICSAIQSHPPCTPVTVYNWWAPDLPRLIGGCDYVLVVHPQFYGAGPLWNPVNLELLVAALASDPLAGAVVMYADPDGPRTGVPNHVHAVDVPTIQSWAEQNLAALFRREALLRAFPPVNPGESRNLRPVAEKVRHMGYRVLAVPQQFPMSADRIDSAAAEISARLPAEPKAAIRGLYITQWLECGGADKGAVDLLTRVDPNVVDFSLLTTVASAHPWECRVRGHVREIVHLGGYLPLPPEKRFPRFIVEYIRRRNIGLVHIMHSFLGYDALPLLKSELPGVKVLDQCHILEPPSNMQGGHPAYSSRRYKQYFDHRTVTSEWLKRYLVKSHGIASDTVSVIYTGVDTEREFAPSRYPRGEFRARLGISSETKLVVFVGRLHWQKRPELFVRIAGEVLSRRPGLDVTFALVGPGPQMDELREQISKLPRSERVLLAGEEGHGGPVFRDADLLLMPSRHEGLAYVSYEAMAMGVPQVFTAVNGQPELITPETGVLIPSEGPEDLVEAGTQAVIGLLEDDAGREAMGHAARERVVRKFGIDKMVREYEALYRRLAGGPAIQ